jgi:hypothetical protein
MRCLTLFQPWATLIALDAKRYETRSWATSYRGPLAIHAAKRPPEVVREAMPILARCHLWRDPLTSPGLPALPLGAVVCIVELVAIYSTTAIVDRLSEQERAFGDYSPDRYAWQLELVEVFKRPIPARGAQGLWEWDHTARHK